MVVVADQGVADHHELQGIVAGLDRLNARLGLCVHGLSDGSDGEDVRDCGDRLLELRCELATYTLHLDRVDQLLRAC